MGEFDKEAERERLREKFEAEEADRATARQMGELLLRGARMTDRHCPECGSPLFEEEGTVFCPTCEREVVEVEEGEEPRAVMGAETAELEGTVAEASGVEATVSATASADGTPRRHLEAALERSAAAAARTDDPRLAREHLEAAKAAIEAIEALDGQSGS
ncbi:MAG: Sjogren's syndrome/scleroderma autoantigen 1 family protein [Halobacteriota archaeon]